MENPSEQPPDANHFPNLMDDLRYNRSHLFSSSNALLELCTRVASGEQLACAEVDSQDDFISWKRGVSL